MVGLTSPACNGTIQSARRQQRRLCSVDCVPTAEVRQSATTIRYNSSEAPIHELISNFAQYAQAVKAASNVKSQRVRMRTVRVLRLSRRLRTMLLRSKPTLQLHVSHFMGGVEHSTRRAIRVVVILMERRLLGKIARAFDCRGRRQLQTLACSCNLPKKRHGMLVND